MLTDITYDIPFGTKNLAPLFADVNWDEVEEYYVELIDQDDYIILSTPTAVVTSRVRSETGLVLHFLNYLSRFDTVVFYRCSEADEVKSDSWTKALPVAPGKRDYGTIRSNISARDTYSATTIAYSEKQMKWIKQLLESPLAYLQWTGTENQPDDFIPVVIVDQTMETKKMDERYVYEFTISFKSANEKIPLRI